jgi:hypothetical protein
MEEEELRELVVRDDLGMAAYLEDDGTEEE